MPVGQGSSLILLPYKSETGEDQSLVFKELESIDLGLKAIQGIVQVVKTTPT
jgi:hypothetical protein